VRVLELGGIQEGERGDEGDRGYGGAEAHSELPWQS
jgi:hypothetical protein